VRRRAVRVRDAVLQAGPAVRAVHRARTAAPAALLRRQLAVRARRRRRHRQAYHEQAQRARRQARAALAAAGAAGRQLAHQGRYEYIPYFTAPYLSQSGH
jgi:hypothetical protein